MFVIHFGCLGFPTPPKKKNKKKKNPQTNNKVGPSADGVRKLDPQLAQQPSELKSFSYDKVWEYRYIDVFSPH
jgi:hypothetical protein